MKKAVSLLLVLVLVLGMSTVAFAAKTGKMQKDQSNQVGFQNGSYDLGEVKVGINKEHRFLVWPGNFAWSDAAKHATSGKLNDLTSYATKGILAAGVLKTEVSNSKLTLRSKITKGSNVIKKFEFKYDKKIATSGTTEKGAEVVIEFVDPFKSNNTDGQDFDFTVYPVVDGRAWPDLGAVITGTLKNDEVDIDGATDYIDLSYSAIAVVDEYSKSVEYALGEGVSLYGRAIKGAKYWGVANKDASDAEDAMMAEKGIDEIYHVPVIGLNSVANYVTLNDADPTAYVYDKDFNYLGLAKENLPYSDTYYLSDKKLDLDSEEEPEDDFEDDEEGDIPVAPPVTGGEGTAAPTYDNPSTGK